MEATGRENGTSKFHYLREWREYRGYSLEKMAESMKDESGEPLLSSMSLSRLERDEQAFTIEQLFTFAQILTTTPSALIEQDPKCPIEDIASLYKQLDDGHKRMVSAMINAALDKA